MGEGAQRRVDRFANFAQATVTESGANTETFSEVLTGISLGQGIGILVDQIDYYILPAMLELIVASGDAFMFGWTTSSGVGALGVDSRRTIHVARVSIGTVIGTPASAGNLFVQPLSFKFDPPPDFCGPPDIWGGRGVGPGLRGQDGFPSVLSVPAVVHSGVPGAGRNLFAGELVGTKKEKGVKGDRDHGTQQAVRRPPRQARKPAGDRASTGRGKKITEEPAPVRRNKPTKRDKTSGKFVSRKHSPPSR